jgi:Ni/Fe-hydrogenase subunit HybB-like protein
MRLPPEREVLSGLARFTPFVLGMYLSAKLADLAARGVLQRVLDASRESFLWLAEVGLGVVAPLVILSSGRRRRSIAWLFAAASLVIGGVVLNRLNVFLLCYTPVNPTASYSPSAAEFAVTAGFVAMIVLIYRAIVLNLPVIEALEVRASNAPARSHSERRLRSGPAFAKRRTPGWRMANVSGDTVCRARIVS